MLNNYRVITYELKQRTQGDPLKLSSISSLFKILGFTLKMDCEIRPIKISGHVDFLRIQTKNVNLLGILESNFSQTNKNYRLNVGYFM